MCTLKKKGDDYAEPKRSSDEKYTLRGLDSNTEYTVKVTGFAGPGDETTASNEFAFVTANRPPTSPTEISMEEDNRGRVKLSWQPATDPDGRVVWYRVYTIKDKERILAGQSSYTGFILKAGTEYDRLVVTAVDDRGAESGGPVIRQAGVSDYSYTLGFTAGIIYPMANFSDLAGIGYGGTLAFTKHDLFIPGLEAGISAGFYYLTGVKNNESKLRETGRSFFVPGGLNIGYRIKPLETLSLVPYTRLQLGMVIRF